VPTGKNHPVEDSPTLLNHRKVLCLYGEEARFYEAEINRFGSAKFLKLLVNFPAKKLARNRGLVSTAMSDHRPRRRKRKDDGIGYPLFVGSCALLAAFAFLNTDKLPKPLVSASRNLEHEPPAGAYYGNCAEARAAGVAPLYADEPGYRPELDRDSDGVACEPYRGM